MLRSTNVLESFYEVGRERLAELMRAIVGFPAIVVLDEPLLLRALELYEVDRLDFADAYLVASAEASGVQTIASFAPDVRPCVRDAGGLAQLGHVACRFLRLMGARDPLELVGADGAEGQGSSSGTG